MSLCICNRSFQNKIMLDVKSPSLCLYGQGADEMGKMANQKVMRTQQKALNLFIFASDNRILHVSKTVAID